LSAAHLLDSISFLSPRFGRDVGMYHKTIGGVISIHSPRVGRDSKNDLKH